MIERERCGRPTTKKKPCRFKRWQLRYSDPFGWTPPACGTHLTQDEWQEVYKIEDSYWERKEEADRRETEDFLARVDWAALNDNSCSRGPCDNMRMLAWNHGATLPDPRACSEHFTPEEWEAFANANQERDERFARLEREPDCWSWPVPDSRQYATEEEADDALHAWQHGHGCAICGDRCQLVTDHDHQTGLVRGQLCRTCNTKEGMGYERPPFVKYRERNPASILGVKVRYWSSWTGYAEPVPVLTAQAEAEEQRRLRDAVEGLWFPSPDDLRDTERDLPCGRSDQ